MVELEKSSAMKAKQHTVYKTKDGKRVCGVTTITGVLDKPALKFWANQLGLAGVKVQEYVDDLAAIGTLAHYMIECHIKKVKPNLDDSSKNQIDKAENSFLKFLEWEKQHKIQFIKSEMSLVSEKHRYGGTIDIYCILDGVYTLLDIKTCKGLYPDQDLQVGGGYFPLLIENGYKVEQAVIVKVGRSDNEGLNAECRVIPNLAGYQKMFLLCRDIYEIKKELCWDRKESYAG